MDVQMERWMDKKYDKNFILCMPSVQADDGQMIVLGFNLAVKCTLFDILSALL